MGNENNPYLVLLTEGTYTVECEVNENCKVIDGGAFENCYFCLKSITIPNSVTSIGNYAFYDCDDLTTINYQGTKAEWNAITKGYLWNSSTGDYTVFCTDGKLDKNGNVIS